MFPRPLNLDTKIIACALLLLTFLGTSEADDKFSSEAIGLITTKQSKDITDKLMMGLGQSSDIRTHVPKEELRKFVSFYNSGMLMTSFPINKEIGDAYLLEVSERMSSLKRITYMTEYTLGENEPDGSVMTTVSLVPISDDKTIMEVAIAAFDWKKAIAKKTGMQGVHEAVIWHSISRKTLPLPSKGITSNWGENPLVREAYSQLVKSNFEMFLVSF